MILYQSIHYGNNINYGWYDNHTSVYPNPYHVNFTDSGPGIVLTAKHQWLLQQHKDRLLSYYDIKPSKRGQTIWSKGPCVCLQFSCRIVKNKRGGGGIGHGWEEKQGVWTRGATHHNWPQCFFLESLVNWWMDTVNPFDSSHWNFPHYINQVGKIAGLPLLCTLIFQGVYAISWL